MSISSAMPTSEGFYWGIWKIKAIGTADEDDPPGHEWEVMHVVKNTLDPSDDEHLMVMVPGVQKWQALENFFWGEAVNRNGEANLAGLLRRLMYRHSKGLSLDDVFASANGYLTRHKLHGSILREDGSKQALGVEDK